MGEVIVEMVRGYRHRQSMVDMTAWFQVSEGDVSRNVLTGEILSCRQIPAGYTIQTRVTKYHVSGNKWEKDEEPDDVHEGYY